MALDKRTHTKDSNKKPRYITVEELLDWLDDNRKQDSAERCASRMRKTLRVPYIRARAIIRSFDGEDINRVDVLQMF
jgi:hypothetical protein